MGMRYKILFLLIALFIMVNYAINAFLKPVEVSYNGINTELSLLNVASLSPIVRPVAISPISLKASYEAASVPAIIYKPSTVTPSVVCKSYTGPTVGPAASSAADSTVADDCLCRKPDADRA